MSDGGIDLFTGLGPLIRTWRKAQRVSQATFAVRMGVSDREVRRWETSTQEVSSFHLQTMARITTIPTMVLVALNARLPIYYSISRRIYKFTAAEVLISTERSSLWSAPEEDSALGKTRTISMIEQAAVILDYHSSAHPSARPVPAVVVMASAKYLGDMNLYSVDPWERHAGHLVCLPLRNQAYGALRMLSREESDLALPDLVCPSQADEVTLLMYSTYACSSALAHMLMRKVGSFLIRGRLSPDSLLAGYASTPEEVDFCRCLGMHQVRSPVIMPRVTGASVPRSLFEVRVAELMSRANSRGAHRL